VPPSEKAPVDRRDGDERRTILSPRIRIARQAVEFAEAPHQTIGARPTWRWLSSNPQASQAKNRFNGADGATSNVEVAPAG